MRHVFIIISLIFIFGCSKFVSDYKIPTSYEVNIGSTTLQQIVNTFGMTTKSENFVDNNIDTVLNYSCNRSTGLMLCINKYGKQICNPCGAPSDQQTLYSNVMFRFTDGIVTLVKFFTGRPQHPIIPGDWPQHADPKSSLGNVPIYQITHQ